MGYSNYFRTDREFTSSEWNVITNMAKHVISVSGIIIRNAAGKEKPTINNDEISINGCAYLGEDSESFVFTRLPCDKFCKTNRKPYDDVCMAILQFIEMTHRDSIKISSDGDWEPFWRDPSLRLLAAASMHVIQDLEPIFMYSGEPK